MTSRSFDVGGMRVVFVVLGAFVCTATRGRIAAPAALALALGAAEKRALGATAGGGERIALMAGELKIAPGPRSSARGGGTHSCALAFFRCAMLLAEGGGWRDAGSSALRSGM